MKKITLQFLFTILLASVGFAQGSQDFETQTALIAAYTDGSFTENGITYTFVHSRDEADYSITGKGIMLRRPNEPSSLEWTIPNGIGTLSFDARKAFTGASPRQLEVLVNGVSVWTSPTFGEGSGPDATIHPFSIPINEQGSTTVRIKIAGTGTVNRQVTLDNISWTASPCIGVVNIPDANFKNALLTHAPTIIDTNGDGEIQCSEAEAFADSMFLIFKGITDMTGIEAFVNMTNLYCGFNSIATLDVSSNTQLEMLYCQNNEITNLNITGLTSLTYLFCSDNQLTSLDLSTNTALENLLCYTNELTNLDVSNNVNLTDLMCFDNQLSSLDLNNNNDLKYLACENNGLTTLDLSNNTDLEYLRCNNNQITALDLSSHPNLKDLQCQFNQLSSLNVKNGNNTSLLVFNSIANTNLICIEVDDADYSTTTWTAVDGWSTFSEECNPPCVVSIPDAAFKTALLTHNPVIDTNGDGEIQCDEAEAFTGMIDLFGFFPMITDLTGIEAFVNITLLDVGAGALTTLDLSSNTLLEVLYCDANQLTSLNVSNNTALKQLFCGNNSLTTLDVSNNTVLTLLGANNNQFTTLDVSNNTDLEELYCYENQLTSLDISNNTNLDTLLCFNNQLTTLDLSNNTDLMYLLCDYNQLTTLDLTNNTSLEELTCTANQLVSLNVKNGNNINVTFFDATDNPDLICIEVDDADYSTANWVDIDQQTSFSEDCVAFLTVDRMDLVSIVAYPNPVNDILHFSSNQPIENVVVSNMLGQQINVSISSDKTKLDMSNLASGNYFVKVTIDGVAKMIKVVKQ